MKRWAKGFGVIRHNALTRRRVASMARALRETGDGLPVYELLAAADRLASAAMWLTVHDTYAREVRLDGRPLTAEAFKAKPEGHTGSALNVCPAYVGYLAANALTGHTRSWLMEQGHAVSGIDCVNMLTGNVVAAYAARYDVSDEGLSRFVSDFYSYRLDGRGRQEAPRGSHVNANTAGGIAEGGYLGFAGLQYVHMPLPGERLVAFLSDGAFEEQRGPDWAPRWWRHQDSGLVAPIMICNGRRIDQRTTMRMEGGSAWFKKHLRLNSFDPIEFDGSDPAAYAWAIWEMERRLAAAPKRYPVRLPYGVAVVAKGYGFPGAGTNAAHNLPLGAEVNKQLIDSFNLGAAALHVPPKELGPARAAFQKHRRRPKEAEHALAARDVSLKRPVEPDWLSPGASASPMEALDGLFAAVCRANPELRARLGNPDEVLSNRLGKTLAFLKHRVCDPEAGAAEAVLGGVITALNEEAVVSAALANKGGINMVATYEAFGTKMHGALRQEVIFAESCGRHGRPQRWLSIPLVLSSHTYENGKNEHSHQDPSLSELMLGEHPGVSRVFFPPDANAALAVLSECYRTKGQIWTIVNAKGKLPVILSSGEAGRLTKEGGLVLKSDKGAALILTAVGAYQLEAVLRAGKRLEARSVPHRIVCLQEPRRLAAPERFYPGGIKARLFLTHTRPAPMRGVLERFDTGARTAVLGFRNEGGTLDAEGMLFVNGQSWAHALKAAALLLDLKPERLLEPEELAAVEGQRSPHGTILP